MIIVIGGRLGHGKRSQVSRFVRTYLSKSSSYLTRYEVDYRHRTAQNGTN